MILELPMPYYKAKALMSLNVYRNMHHYQLNNFKTDYGSKIKKILQEYDSLKTPLSIHYHIDFKGYKSRDVSNILSMVDKVFQDVLVQLKMIPDDGLEFVYEVKMTGGLNAKETKLFVRVSEAEQIKHADYKWIDILREED